MRIIAISDTHGEHRNIPYVPDGDIFIHAGDFLNFGQETTNFGSNVLKDFYHWLKSLPHKYKILVGGNHDWFLHEEPERIKELPCIYLQDASIEIEGLKIYGTPWVPYLMGIGYFAARRGADMIEKLSLIPDDIDVLISHSAPFGQGDTAYNKQHIGCVDLMNRVEEIRPKLHIFGHIHSDRGFNKEIDGIRFVNVAYDKRGSLAVIDMERD